MTNPFDGHLQPGRSPALLVVDVVMAYLKPTSAFYAHAEAALACNERLVAAARSVGAPVLFTNVEYQADGADGGLFYRKVPALQAFLKGSPLGAFPPTLQPAAGELVVTKQCASAFFGTSLASTLCTMSVDTLLITGFSTSGCVRASALDALQNGFSPFVVADACASETAQSQSARPTGQICGSCRRSPRDRHSAERSLWQLLLQPNDVRLSDLTAAMAISCFQSRHSAVGPI